MARAAALVTGTSSGIGQDIARELARRGYDLVLVARRRDRLDALAEEITAATGRACLVLPCDLTDRGQLNGLMARTQEWLADGRRLDVLVNNAGAGVWDSFADQTTAISQRDIDLNITAPTTLCHEFVTQARAHGQPAYILNIASLAAMLPTPRFAVYSATKSYVLRLSEILAHELRDSNVRVTCACPGGVLTEFTRAAGQELKGEVGMMQSDEVARLSVDAMFAGETVFVPGLLNKASALVRFLPRPLKIRLVERSMAVTVKEK
jgi:short-subunit dehydrogenase